MDRFKFRVWNNKHNRYIVDSHYPIGSDHIIVIQQDGKAYNLGLGDYEDYSNMHSWAVKEEFTDCIIEQCTGLKDKNGNLIYEGDLLFDGEFCGVVIWKDSSWQVRFELYDGDSGYERLDQHFAKFGQIYGNIHEQKD